MTLMIVTDIEGCAGVLDFENWCVPGGLFYLQGRRLLTLETNAAIEGFRAGGIDEIIVVDGHGAGALDPELLDERVWLHRGKSKPGTAWGMDDGVDALAIVGQHAKAGTPYSHLTHTQWFNYIDLSVNGISIGEYGQLALCAMELGLPTIFASGEKALCEEAQALTPGVVTAWGKYGTLPDGLDHLSTADYGKAKLAAIHRSPASTRRLIRERAEEAARRLNEQPESFTYPRLEAPFIRTARFRQQGDQAPYEARDEHPSSWLQLVYEPYTPIT